MLIIYHTAVWQYNNNNTPNVIPEEDKMEADLTPTLQFGSIDKYFGIREILSNPKGKGE